MASRDFGAVRLSPLRVPSRLDRCPALKGIRLEIEGQRREQTDQRHVGPIDGIAFGAVERLNPTGGITPRTVMDSFSVTDAPESGWETERKLGMRVEVGFQD